MSDVCAETLPARSTWTAKERRALRQPFVYFLRCEGFVKIGFTTEPARRLLNCQVGNPFTVTIAAQVFGDEALETSLHNRFRKLRHRDEWFRDEGDLMVLVDELATMEPEDGRWHAMGALARPAPAAPYPPPPDCRASA